RPSVVYEASVVLIEGKYPARSPLPVLTRGPQDRGVFSQPDLTPPFPTLLAVTPPNQQPGAKLGDLVTIQGHHLDGDSVVVRFSNPRLRVTNDLTPQPGATATEIRVELPNDAA